MIMNLIRWLFMGCKHKWTIIQTTVVYKPFANTKFDTPIAHLYIQKCDHCGKLNKFMVEG